MEDIEWWWIDYLENELDSVLENDLLTLLQHSQEDRESFENFRLLKQWVRESDPVGSWPLEERTHRMRANVMAAIADLEIEPVLPERKRRERLRAIELGAEI
jgi:hypothetical protein